MQVDVPPAVIGAAMGLIGAVVRLMLYGNGSLRRSAAIIILGGSCGGGISSAWPSYAAIVGLVSGIVALALVESVWAISQHVRSGAESSKSVVESAIHGRLKSLNPANTDTNTNTKVG